MKKNEVGICTAERDLPVVFGTSSYYGTRCTIEDVPVEALASVKYLLADVNDIRSRYIALGFHLIEFDRCRYYFRFGYDTLADFAAANLGMDKSAVSRCMAVCRKFCDVAGKYQVSPRIAPAYAEYSYSQLCELATLDQEYHREVTPQMTIQEIREVKRSHSPTRRHGPDPDGDPAAPRVVATSQPEQTDPMQDLIREAFPSKCAFNSPDAVCAFWRCVQSLLEDWVNPICLDADAWLSSFSASGKRLSFTDGTRDYTLQLSVKERPPEP